MKEGEWVVPIKRWVFNISIWEDRFFIKRLRRMESWKKNKEEFRVWDFDGRV